MKKVLLFVALIVTIALFTCMLSSCELDFGMFLPSDGPSVDEGGGNTDTPNLPDDGTVGGDDGGSDEPPADEPPADEPPEEELLTFIIKERINGDRIAAFKVSRGFIPSTNEDVMNAINNASYHGYGFVAWYTEQSQTKEEYLFNPNTAIFEDLTIWGDRGKLAGPDITWDYDLATDTLKLTGSGPMYNFKYNDDAPWIKYASLVKKIIFNGEITTIGDHSFYQFKALSKVVLPDSIISIGENSFYDSSVTHINFPPNLELIGKQAFKFCEGLTELEFNQGLQEIRDGAFNGDYNITSVILTDKIAELGTSAFQDCNNLQTAYYMGTEEQYNQIVVRLDNFWVQQLANTYYLSESKPAVPGPYWHLGENGETINWYYTIGYFSEANTANGKVPFAFDYVDPEIGITQDHIDFLADLWYHGYQFASWIDIDTRKQYNMQVGTVLSDDLRLRGNRGNKCGANLTWKISGGVLSISGNGAMWDFQKSGDAPWEGRAYSSITIDSGVTYIGSNAFCNNLTITSIDIPTNIKGIHKNTFVGNVSLRYIYFLGTEEELASVQGINDLADIGEAKVYVRSDDLSTVNGSYWRLMKGTDDIEGRVAWRVEEGTLYVGGAETLTNYSRFGDTPWASLKDEITKIVIINGANRVGAYSFAGMKNVTEITIPASVHKIAATAFEGTGVYDNTEGYVDGALYISNHLIRVEPSLVGTEFRIKEGTLSIAENAFYGCDTITDLLFNKEIVGVCIGAMAGLTSLERLYFSGTSIDGWNYIWSSGNDLESQNLGSVTIYCFSKYQPATTGNWWYYGASQAITIWPS